MKNKSKELDVDFIGGQGPLTKQEEEAISNYIRAYKAKNSAKKAAVKQPNRKRGIKRKKAMA